MCSSSALQLVNSNGEKSPLTGGGVLSTGGLGKPPGEKCLDCGDCGCCWLGRPSSPPSVFLSLEKVHMLTESTQHSCPLYHHLNRARLFYSFDFSSPPGWGYEGDSVERAPSFLFFSFLSYPCCVLRAFFWEKSGLDWVGLNLYIGGGEPLEYNSSSTRNYTYLSSMIHTTVQAVIYYKRGIEGGEGSYLLYTHSYDAPKTKSKF